jgi:hypothetical protein
VTVFRQAWPSTGDDAAAESQMAAAVPGDGVPRESQARDLDNPPYKSGLVMPHLVE